MILEVLASDERVELVVKCLRVDGAQGQESVSLAGVGCAYTTAMIRLDGLRQRTKYLSKQRVLH